MAWGWPGAIHSTVYSNRYVPLLPLAKKIISNCSFYQCCEFGSDRIRTFLLDQKFFTLDPTLAECLNFYQVRYLIKYLNSFKEDLHIPKYYAKNESSALTLEVGP